MGHVFISYSRKDQQFVDALVIELRKAGVAIWRDEDSISPGMEWRTEITKALEEAEAVLIVWSQSASRSEWVQAELLFARDTSSLIIPIIIAEPNEDLHLPLLLESRQFIRFRSREEFPSVVQEILRALPKSVIQNEPQQPKVVGGSKYVFISYASEDVEFVKSLRIFLEGKGYAFWDYKQADREYSVPFHLELERAIKNAKATLCILSPEWKNSRWSAREHLFSELIGKPIFVLKVRDEGPTLLTVDLTPLDFELDTKLGFDKLDKALQREGLV